MKLNVIINDRQHEVELQTDASPLVAFLGGTRHELTLHHSPTTNAARDRQTPPESRAPAGPDTTQAR